MTKKIFWIFLFFSHFILADQYDWDIITFHSHILVQQDSQVDVTETIQVDFRDQRHGIYRDLPIIFKNRYGMRLKTRLEVIGVSDQNQQPRPYKVSRKGPNISIKIGDANQLVRGEQIYEIHYKIQKVIGYFENHDELYWNATGNQWPVSIHSSSCEIELQTNQSIPIQGKAFTGWDGSTESNAKIDNSQMNRISFIVNQRLYPGEGLTVVAGWPKEILQKPSTLKNIYYFLLDNWILLIPFLVFIYLSQKWYRLGRDPKGNRTIVVQYDAPAQLTPAEVGTMIDDSADLIDITASIIDMAVRGYLEIHVTGEKGIFSREQITLKKKTPTTYTTLLKPFEATLLSALFGSRNSIDLKELKNKFYTQLPGIKKGIYQELIKNHYLESDPSKIRAKYMAIGAILIILGLISPVVTVHLGMILSGLIGLILSGIVTILFARIMPRKTPLGVKTLEHIKGFEEYLSRAEKEELALVEKQKRFEKFLPYAMALGVADEWADKFEDIYKTPPDWLTVQNYSTWNTYYLMRTINSTSKDMRSTFVSSPRSAGGSSGFSGGSSGGGFGGGGGGSW